VYLPTAKTTIVPLPSIIFDPEIRKQLSFGLLKSMGGFFSIGSLSPVIEDSSDKILLDVTTTPSTGKISPVTI